MALDQEWDMDAKTLKGSCLCSTVTYEIQPPFLFFRYCHCPRCRKATGSAHVANLFLAPDQFRWVSGTDCVVRYDLPEARSFGTCFCRTCGSPLPRLSRDGARLAVPAGSLDDDPQVRPEHSIFWDFRAPWYKEPGDIPKYRGYPPDRT
jgi:hypothetical protein